MSEKIKIGGYLLVISVILGLVYFLLIAPLNSNSIPSSKHSGFFNQVCTEGFGMMVSQPNTNKEPTNSKSQFST